MRIPRLYCPLVHTKSNQILLSRSLTHYLIHVLKNKIKSTVILFNNQDSYEYYANITEVNSKKTIIQIIDKKKIDTESNISINIFQALSKNSKIATIIQKTTELGVRSITVVNTEYSNSKITDNKIKRWQKIAIHAAEQSGRVFFPTIYPVISFNEVLLKKTSINLLLSPNENFTIHQLLRKNNNASNFNILIGPEGGFSKNELITSKNSNYNNITLGSRILRTETAPIVICSILQTLWGDF